MLDRNKTIGIVLGHASAKSTIERHIPFWFKSCKELVIVIPEDHSLDIQDDSKITVYKFVPNAIHKPAYSAATSARCHEAMKIALKNHPAEYYILFEWDSLCWKQIPDDMIPDDNEVTACKWDNEPVSPIKGISFKAEYYLHFPHIYSKESLEKISKTITKSVPYETEHGYTDRFVGAAAIAAGLKVKNTREIGRAYSWQDVCLSKFPRRVNECIEGIKNGVILTHGIKDAETLNHILSRVNLE